MTKALGLSAFVLIVLTPFVDDFYVIAGAACLMIAICFDVIATFVNHHKHRPRPLNGEIDEAQLQCQLSEFVRQINAEDGK